MRVQFGEPLEVQFSPEVSQNLKIAEQAKANHATSIANAKSYNEGISTKAVELKSLTMDLGDNITLDFKLPEGSEKSLVQTIQDAPQWKNEDGTWNHEAVVRDTAIISNLPEMLKLAYEQGKNSGTDQTIQEAKNTTLGQRNSNDSALPRGGKGVEIEGLDKFLGKTRMKIGRRN